MLKQLAASHFAKTLALCVCPIVTAGVVAVKEPHVRRMIHKATGSAPEKVGRHRAALSAVSLPPCTPVGPFATLPRVSAALPAAVGLPGEGAQLTPTAASAPEAVGSAFNPGFGSPGGFVFNPSGPSGGGGVIPPTFPGGGTSPTSPVSGVPEPETWVQILAGLGLAGAGIRVLRARKELAKA
ncbi:hypothetical protein SPAN111604_12060 [Sphingomonas antarctica]|uniref:PEP-CTERM sorting domain-containing protein n=1 Tax=Sphingomonas antarctica TaxID=2040274 RepID=UPI0039EA743C